MNDMIKKTFTQQIKAVLLLLPVLFLSMQLKAQVSVTATTGTVGPTAYTTLKAAFDAVNLGTHTGAVTISITANTTETAQAVLNPSGTGGASYTAVLVKPAASTTPIITGSIATSVIKLWGSDNVTIDGSNTMGGTTQNLTISNSNTGTSSAVVWVGSYSTSDGATGNAIKNCVLTGNTNTTTNSGIISCNGSTLGSAADFGNSNNTYQNNAISKAYNGIALLGPATGGDQNTTINGNQIGSTVTASKIGGNGMFISNQQNVSVTGNIVAGATSASGAIDGIYLGGVISSGAVTGNKVSDIKSTVNSSANAAIGIWLAPTSTGSNLTIANNFIYDISAIGATGGYITSSGFYITQGGGYKIYHNSVSITASTQTVASAYNVCIYVSATITTANCMDVRDNIFSNTATVGGANRFAFYSGAANTVYQFIDYNDYASSGTYLGYIGGTRAAITNWRTGTTKDVNSISVAPAFTSSTTDLHLPYATNAGLRDLGTYLSAVPTDIDGDQRNPTTPDMGADEFSITPIVSSFTPNACIGGSVIITGYFFTGTSAVTIAGISAVYTVNSATQITATVPAGVTSGVIAVTNPTYGTGTSAGSFSITPAATITSFTPTTGNAGTNIVITGTGFTGATAVTFNGMTASFTVNSATQITATAPAGVATGTVAVTNACGAVTTGGTFTVIPPCATPTAQPTALVNTSTTASAISNTFTNALPVPDGYLVVQSTGALTGNPVDGTVYTAGMAAGSGTVVQASVATGFSAAALTGNTAYTYTIFSYSAGMGCAGPVYLTASPLTGTFITCPAATGTPTATAITNNSFNVAWTAPVGGSASPLTYTLEVATDNAFSNIIYTNAAATSPQAVTGLSQVTPYYFRVRATGACTGVNSATGTATTVATYDAGVTALSLNGNCPGTQMLNVTIKNYGAVTLTSVTVTPTIGGVAQTPVVLTGLSIASGNTSVQSLGSYTIAAPGSLSLSAATSLPNGNTDAVPGNDAYSTTAGIKLNGTYTVGAAGNFPTLTAAVAAYNANGVCGPVLFSLTDASYSAAETFPIVFNAAVTGVSSTNTLTIKPAGGVSPVISGSSALAILKLSGADYIIMDGSNTTGGTSQDLTITNTNTGTTSGVLWVASAGSSDGATNDTIKNCVVYGNGPATTFGAIISSSGTTLGGVADFANNNNAYLNNAAYKAQFGIAVVGPTGNETGTVITGNQVGSTVAGNKLGAEGIFMAQQQNIIVSGNTVFGLTSTTASTVGIFVSGTMSGGSITGNQVSDVKYTGASTGAAYGVYLNSGSTTGNVTVANNFIYDVSATGAAGYITTVGISAVLGGGYKIYHNSVSITAANQTAATSVSTGLYLSTGVTTAGSFDIRNNIFSNTATTGGAAYRYAIYNAAANSVIQAIDYNDYASSGTYLGYINAANRTLIADVRTGSGYDVHSVAVAPVFVSPTDLHLNTASCTNSALNNAATYIAAVPTDIDGQARSATTPDIGADEFAGQLITAVITGPSGPVCAGSPITLTESGGTATSWSWSTGAATQSITVAPTANTTYTVTASNAAGCTATASVTIGVNPLPTVPTITPPAATICQGAIQSLVASGSTIPNTALPAENFNTLAAGAIPAGWSTIQSATVTWGAVASANAGGTSKEMRLNCLGATTTESGIYALTAPMVNAAGWTALNFSFKHMLSNYSATIYPYVLKMQTSTDNTTWTDRWSFTPTGTTAYTATPVNVSLTALNGQPYFYYRFVLSGLPFGANYWYIDDVAVTGTPQTVSYSWMPAAGLYSNNTATTLYTAGTAATTVYASPATAGSYTYTDTVASTTTGCTNTAVAAITVNGLPAAAISGTPTICTGSVAPLTVTFTGTQPFNFTYTDGVTPGNASGITTSPYTLYVSPASASSYTLTSATDAGCAAAPAGLTGTGAVTVNTPPASLALATSTSNTLVDQSGAAATDYKNDVCELITTLQPSGASPVSGLVTSTVTIGATAGTVNNDAYVRRVYYIEPVSNAGTSTATITLYATNADFADCNSVATGLDPNHALLPATPTGSTAKVRVMQYHNNGNPGSSPAGSTVITPTAVTWDATNSRWALEFPVTGFSNFYIFASNTASPLPVDLLDLAAANEGSRNKIEWHSGVENGLDHYDILRSRDGISFEKIDEVPAQGKPWGYIAYDKMPFDGINYYRLNMVSLNGTNYESKVVSAMVRSNNGFIVQAHPNPVSNVLTIDVTGAGGNANIILTDVTGKVLSNVTVTNNTATLQMSGLATGIYYVRYNDDNRSQTIKINKQ